MTEAIPDARLQRAPRRMKIGFSGSRHPELVEGRAATRSCFDRLSMAFIFGAIFLLQHVLTALGHKEPDRGNPVQGIASALGLMGGGA